MALVTIDGKGYTVGLNETLPGNARITAIRADHVILTADGRRVRLDLKR
jgi:type II secretory pathway component PulC